MSITPTARPADIADADLDVMVADVRLRVRELGDPTADPVLVLHGIMGHRREWQHLVRTLAAGHHVVVPDQRGHGQSARATSYAVAAMADDAIALVEQRVGRPVTIVGHSMGGMVGMTVAARRPDLVDRLVIIDIVPESLTCEFGLQLPDMLGLMAASAYDTLDEAFAEWRDANPLAQDGPLRNYVTHAVETGADGRLRWTFDAEGLRAFMDGVTGDQLWAAIDAVACPTLVIRGEQSPVTTAAQVAEMAARLGTDHVVTIPDGGHDLGVEQPEAVTEAVVQFLHQTTA